MNVRKLVCLISLVTLSSVLAMVSAHFPSTFTKPVQRADGGAPVPPPPPFPQPPAPGTSA